MIRGVPIVLLGEAEQAEAVDRHGDRELAGDDDRRERRSAPSVRTVTSATVT